MEIRHLAALSAIDEERSFRGAADRLGYVQSAVSAQIARLEALVGVRLVERARGHSRVELTPEGRVLLAHADRVLTQLQAAQADLRALVDGLGGTLRVGTFDSVATRVMPRVLSRLAAQHPEIVVVPTEAPTDARHFDAVAGGDLDIAFGELPLEPGPFEARPLMTDPSVLLVHRDSPLALAEGPVPIARVAELPLVAYQSWRMTERIDEHLRLAGVEPRYTFQSDTNTAIQALVSAGLAAAIMPRLAVDEDDSSTTVVELASPLPARRLVLYRHRERTPQPALEVFARTVHDVCISVRNASVDPLVPRRAAADEPVRAAA